VALRNNALGSAVSIQSQGGDVLAVALDTLVGVELFRFNTALSSVGHSSDGPASVAAFALVSTINELLFREGDQDGVVEVVKTFEGTSGGESPA